jgi:acyl-CoA reductase-like NAD-dependent aldehyde dehydrogenase
VADLLEAGQVFVNCHGGPALDFTVGNGGIKQSGIGRELGVDGLREYLETKLMTSRVFG